MIIDVILGVNVDTLGWITNLELSGVENIVVVHYNFIASRNGVLLMSADDAGKN